MDNRYRLRAAALTEKLENNGIDFYIIPMNDFHGSEYIGDHFKTIEYFSGFTGSAGTLLFDTINNERLLWTDGRYFLQGAAELKKSGTRLMRSGEEGVPTIEDHILSVVKDKENAVLGFDGRLIGAAAVEKLKRKLSGIRLVTDRDLAGEVWNEDTEYKRPELASNAIWELRKNFTGMPRSQKLALVRAEMEKRGADHFVISALDEIAWLFNLRGSDIEYNPVFLSYAVIGRNDARLYLNTGDYPRRVLTPMLFDEYAVNSSDRGVKAVDTGEKIYALPYSEFFGDLARIAAGSRVWYDESRSSWQLACTVNDAAGEGKKSIRAVSPIALLKAKKNPIEQDNIRQAHIYDGVAVTRLIYWLKTAVRSGKESADELSVAKKLKELRAEQPTYIDESFAPIIAYRQHGAIVHYEADKDSSIPIRTKGEEAEGADFLLMDTGGHYFEGTTDITRTIVMGKATEEEKRHYTAVLLGNLRLADAVFKDNTPGSRLDYTAREPLYRMGMDFNHGTGHGVGYLLNVHEGPQNISIHRGNDAGMTEGMVTSDEPGVYLEGKYGIRLENLMLCRELYKTSFGRFMGFETLTLVPFDPEALDYDMLTEKDKSLLADYNRKIERYISPLLNEEERQWLEEVLAGLSNQDRD